MRFHIAAALAIMATAPGAAAPTAPLTPVAAAQALPAGRYVLEKSHAKLLWSVDHMGFSDYYGRFDAFDATLTLDPKAPAKSVLTVTIDMASVDSDITALDDTLKGPQWLDAAKFPTATFRSTGVTPAGAGRARVAGLLTLHGVTKPVTLDVRLHGAGMNPLAKAETIGFDATATIRRSEFGVATFLPAIADAVKLTISAEFHPAPVG
jgi:polyisoprenoid-binding protein YceI